MPEVVFTDDLTSFSTHNHRRRRPVTSEVLDTIDLDKALAFYAERFADVGGFTFVFVGNVSLEQLKPLAEAYIGSLPSKGRKETWRDPKITMPSGVQTKTIVKGTEPKSFVSLTYHGPEKWTRDTDNDARMLTEVLRIRLREVLRENMEGVYGINVVGSSARRPRQEYTFNVSFGCAPANVDKLVKAVFAEAKALQEKGIGDDYIAKITETRRRTHETNLKDNGFWLRELERSYSYKDDPKLILDVATMTDKVTSERVRAAANRYLNPKQYILGILKPEGPP